MGSQLAYSIETKNNKKTKEEKPLNIRYQTVPIHLSVLLTLMYSARYTCMLVLYDTVGKQSVEEAVVKQQTSSTTHSMLPSLYGVYRQRFRYIICSLPL